jgi:hypothetical protein
MNIAHVIIEKAVTHFLGNQPIVKLVENLFRNGRQVSDQFEPIKHLSCMIFNDGVGTMRMHWNDVVPNLLKDIEKTVDLDTEFTIQVKGLTADIVVKYDTSSMWFNITSETFDKLFALAVERSKE